MSYLVRKLLGPTVAPPPSTAKASARGAEGDATASDHIYLAEGSSDSESEELTAGTPFTQSAAMEAPVVRSSPNRAVAPQRPPPPSAAPRSATDGGRAVPTRKLLHRIPTCTVAQDRREAMRELSESDDLMYVMGAKEVGHLTFAIHKFPDDEDIVSCAFATLAAITDPETYRQNTSYEVSEREKRQIRDSFIHELVPEVPLFLSFLKSPSFWVKFHAVQLLQRLQEYDPSKVHKLLLASNGIGLIADILNDRSNEGVLRNEGLVLLTSLTATDPELQTIVAFDNVFESLFTIIGEEGGVHGGVIVSDCLTIIHNMLRNNKATQKFFREMGLVANLRQLLLSVTSVLPATSAETKGHRPRPGHLAITPLSNMANMAALMLVSIISCLLREAIAQSDGDAARDSLTQGGIVEPLATVALCGKLFDDGTSIEALRALAMLLDSNPSAAESFLQQQGPTVLRLEPEPQVAYGVRGLWVVLRLALVSADVPKQAAAMQILHALLSLPSRALSVAHELLRGFAAVDLTAALPVDDRHGPGHLLSVALFSMTVLESAPAARYYAAVILEHLSTINTVGEALVPMPWASPHGATSGGAGRLSAPPPVPFFQHLAQTVIRCVHGAYKTDLATSCALFRPLLKLLLTGSNAFDCLLRGDSTLYSQFLRGAATPGPSHLRLWCVVIAAAVCIAAPRDAARLSRTAPSGHHSLSSPGATMVPSVLATGQHLPHTHAVHPPIAYDPAVPVAGSAPPPTYDKNRLLEQFINTVGSGSIINDLLFDIQATCPEWKEPPASALLVNPPVLYDAPLVECIQSIIKEFRGTFPSIVAALPLPQRQTSPFQSAPGSHERAPDRSTSQGTFHDGRGAAPEHLPHPTNFAAAASTANGSQSSVAHPSEQPLLLQQTQEALASAQREVQQLMNHNAELLRRIQELELQTAVNKIPESQGTPSAATDSIAFLEEALSGKEQEVLHLATSLGMLEKQLQSTTADVDGVLEKYTAMEKERNELLILVAELDEERDALKRHIPRDPPESAALSSSARDAEGGALAPSSNVPEVDRTPVDIAQRPTTPPATDPSQLPSWAHPPNGTPRSAEAPPAAVLHSHRSTTSSSTRSESARPVQNNHASPWATTYHAPATAEVTEYHGGPVSVHQVAAIASNPFEHAEVANLLDEEQVGVGTGTWTHSGALTVQKTPLHAGNPFDATEAMDSVAVNRTHVPSHLSTAKSPWGNEADPFAALGEPEGDFNLR